MEHWLLIKNGDRHFVKQGEKQSLCGVSIRKGERGRNVLYWTQADCQKCRKAYALSEEK
jgi:hypothetical protein